MTMPKGWRPRIVKGGTNHDPRKENVVCINCDHVNPPGSKFCNSCGSKLNPACRYCGQKNPTNSVFCNKCGGVI